MVSVKKHHLATMTRRYIGEPIDDYSSGSSNLCELRVKIVDIHYEIGRVLIHSSLFRYRNRAFLSYVHIENAEMVSINH